MVSNASCLGLSLCFRIFEAVNVCGDTAWKVSHSIFYLPPAWRTATSAPILPQATLRVRALSSPLSSLEGGGFYSLLARFGGGLLPLQR